MAPKGCAAIKPNVVPGYNWMTWQEGATLGAGIGGGLVAAAVIAGVVYFCKCRKKPAADPLTSAFLPP